MKKFILTLSLITLSAVQLFAEEYEESFQKILNQFEEAYRTKNIDLLEFIYDEKVTYLPGNQNLGVENRHYLFNHIFKHMIAEKDSTYNIEFQIDQHEAHETWGIVAGYFRFWKISAKEDAPDFYGKFFMLLVKNQHGEWKIRVDADSRCPDTFMK